MSVEDWEVSINLIVFLKGFWIKFYSWVKLSSKDFVGFLISMKRSFRDLKICKESKLINTRHSAFSNIDNFNFLLCVWNRMSVHLNNWAKACFFYHSENICFLMTILSLYPVFIWIFSLISVLIKLTNINHLDGNRSTSYRLPQKRRTTHCLYQILKTNFRVSKSPSI